MKVIEQTLRLDMVPIEGGGGTAKRYRYETQEFSERSQRSNAHKRKAELKSAAYGKKERNALWAICFIIAAQGKLCYGDSSDSSGCLAVEGCVSGFGVM